MSSGVDALTHCLSFLAPSELGSAFAVSRDWRAAADGAAKLLARARTFGALLAAHAPVAACVHRLQIELVARPIGPGGGRASLLASMLRDAIVAGAPYALTSSILAAVSDPHRVLASCDSDGCIPLHLAILHRAPTRLVIRLLDEYPEGAACADEDGCTPLHYAAEECAPEHVARALLRADPAGASHLDTLGRMPLHYAARARADEAVLDLLLDACPEAANTRDAHSRLPAHYALHVCSSARVSGGNVRACRPSERSADADPIATDAAATPAPSAAPRAGVGGPSAGGRPKPRAISAPARRTRTAVERHGGGGWRAFMALLRAPARRSPPSASSRLLAPLLGALSFRRSKCSDRRRTSNPHDTSRDTSRDTSPGPLRAPESTCQGHELPRQQRPGGAVVEYT